MKNLKNTTWDMLFGCLLGDAHIERSGLNMAYLTFEQSIKHKDYVMHIYELLKAEGLMLHDVKTYKRIDSRYGSTNESIYFKTHSSELLHSFIDLFLVNDKKILPLDIEKHLNPITLAYWICDDGQAVKNGGVTLCTDNYSLTEVNLLIQALVNRYELNCSIHNKKGKNGKVYHRVYIKKNSFDNLKPLLIPHIHKSFLYKLHL